MPAVSQFIDGTGPVSQVIYSRSCLLQLPAVLYLDSMLLFHQVQRQK